MCRAAVASSATHDSDHTSPAGSQAAGQEGGSERDKGRGAATAWNAAEEAGLPCGESCDPWRWRMPEQARQSSAA